MKENNTMSNSESDTDDPDDPEEVSKSRNSSEDDEVEETRSKLSETISKKSSELPNKNSDISDSETDIDKPSKNTDIYHGGKSFPVGQSLMRNISSTQGEDSGEESEEHLSESLLQRSMPQQKSPSKKENLPSSSSFSNVPRISEDGGTKIRVERRAQVPEMSPSESDSDDDDDDDDSEDEDSPSAVKIEIPSSLESVETPAPQNTSLSASQVTGTALPWTSAGSLEALYSRLSSPALNIPEDSSVWVLQIPSDMPASHLIGQRFPKKLRGGEVIGDPSFPLQVKEQPSDLSKNSFYCMKSVGGFSYDMQLIHPRGFWTLRRPSFSTEPQKKELGWGVPVVPISVEELLENKSKFKKKHLSPTKHRPDSSSVDHRATGRMSEVASPNKEKKRKHDQSSVAKDISVTSYNNASMSAERSSKKKKTSLDTSDIVEHSQNIELNTTKDKKRKHSSSQIEDMPSPAKKKKKHSREPEPDFQNDFEIHHPLSVNQRESFHQTEQNLAEKQEKHHKKHKHKGADSLDVTFPDVGAIKIEANAMENYETLLNDSLSPKKKKKKKKNKQNSEEESYSSVVCKVELSDDGYDEGNVFTSSKKKKHKRKHSNTEDQDF